MENNSDTNNLEAVVADLFEDFIGEFEIDPDGSLSDMFFEIFCAGFEAALDVLDGDDEDKTSESDTEANTGSEEE